MVVGFIVLFAIALLCAGLMGVAVRDGNGGVFVLFFFLMVICILLGGAVLNEYVDEQRKNIYYDSKKHNTVQTDTTFIRNNSVTDTLIHYQLTEKDFIDGENNYCRP